MPAEAAATPAAAPAAAPPPAAAPATPSGKTPPAFDVRIALAKNLGLPRAEGAPAPAAATTAAGGNIDADPDADPPDNADGEDSAADADEGAADPAGGDGDGADADGGETLTAEAQLEAVTKAFESGDVDAMAKALQKPGVKIAGPVRRAFRAFQRRERAAAERDRKADQRDHEFNEARARAQQQIAEDSRRVSAQERGLIQKYGWAHQLEQAWDSGDTVALAKALEKGCKGASLATITQQLASGKQGKTPEELRAAEDRRKADEAKAAEDRQKQSAEEKKQLEQKREAAVVRVGEALKEHPYLITTNEKGEKVQDAEALKEVFELYEASWNGEKFTKTARKCADELQEKLVARAKARGLAPAPAPAAAPAGKNGKPAPSGKPRPPQRSGVREPPRTATHPRGTPQDLDASRANRLAQARRLTEMQRRGVR